MLHVKSCPKPIVLLFLVDNLSVLCSSVFNGSGSAVSPLPNFMGSFSWYVVLLKSIMPVITRFRARLSLKFVDIVNYLNLGS